MIDIQVQPFDFSSTVVSVIPVSERGVEFFAKSFGSSVFSVEIKKSAFPRFCAMAAERGVIVG